MENERMSNSVLKRLFIRWKKEGDPTAHEVLWMAGDRMVKKIVNKFLQNTMLDYRDAEEAVQVGRLAVGEGLSQWEPERGAYSTFIWTCIRNSLTLYAKSQAAQKFGPDVDDLLDEDYLAETFALDKELMELLQTSDLAYEYWVLGYKQEELAEMYGTSQSNISKMLDEKRTAIEDLLAWGATGYGTANTP